MKIKLKKLAKDEVTAKKHLKKKGYKKISFCYSKNSDDDYYCDIYFRDSQYGYTVTLNKDKSLKCVLYFDHTLAIEEDIVEYPHKLVT